MKKLYYLSGLPRSGSTLLSEILNQNPRIYASRTSGLPEILRGVKDGWSMVSPHGAITQIESETKEINVLKAIMKSYYAEHDEEIIVDKSRAWPKLLETAQRTLDHEPKIIATVRDIKEILASFEILHRKNAGLGMTGMERGMPGESLTIEGRMKVLLQQNQALGSAYTVLRDAVARGWGKKYIHFVDFDDLTSDPETTLRMIYAFLNEDNFEHDFDNVEQMNMEDDRVHGITGLHKIRSKVEPVPSKWEAVLGQGAQEYAGYNFWKTK